MSSAIIQLLVLAGIAIFLILRLRNVLGTRDGFERPKAVTPPESARGKRDFDVIEGGPDRDITDHVTADSPEAQALAAMKRVEPNFSVSEFLQGARGAYEMILMAFETGEIEKVKPFLSKDVYDSFAEVVAARQSRGLTVTSQFIGLRELALTAADFDRGTGEAEITVRFTGELISSAKDAQGNVVEGDPRAPRKQRDSWTFARTMGANDPNWELVATGV